VAEDETNCKKGGLHRVDVINLAFFAFAMACLSLWCNSRLSACHCRHDVDYNDEEPEICLLDVAISLSLSNNVIITSFRRKYIYIYIYIYVCVVCTDVA